MMLRAEITQLSPWLTPKLLRKIRFMFDPKEFTSIWPIVMSHMIQYALSTNLTGPNLRCFLRREGYLPMELSWEAARFYWWNWCKEVEPLWKQLWSKAYPIDFFCQTCCWHYFQHNETICTSCADLGYVQSLPCDKCFCQGKPNLNGTVLCTNHWR